MTIKSPAAQPQIADASTIDATLLDTLDELDHAVNYRDWIVALARPSLAAPILEVGAGHGTFTSELADIGHTHAVEPDPAAYGRLEERYQGDPRVGLTRGTVDDVPAEPRFGSAVMLNVLEHIADDVAALRQLSARIEPGGSIVVWVPAFQFLYSRFDRELGHHRRYRRAGLVDVAERAGLVVTDARYVNLPGWFSWLLICRVLRRRPTGGRLVAVFDRVVVPVVRWIEGRVRPPFGQSILLTARRPDAVGP